MRVAVISSVYGGYDEIAPPPPQDHAAEWVLVSDRDYDCPPWRVVTEPRPACHPRLAAKYAKARPFDYADADVAIWADGNMRLAAGDFVSWCLERLGAAGLAMTPHPMETTIAGEAGLARPLAKYAGQPLDEQVAHYAARGFPDGRAGHWWTGLIVRRRTCPDFGDAWLREMLRFGYEDQISLPYVFWRAGITPREMPLDTARYGWAPHNAEAPRGAACAS